MKDPRAGDRGLLAGYLEHLAHERRLAAHTVRGYARDIAALIDLSAQTPLRALETPEI